MLNNIKTLLAIDVADTSKDELLLLLINQCIQYALEFTHREDVEPLRHIVEQMVVERFNKLKTEGIESTSFNGVSEKYVDGYSSHINQSLRRYRRLRMF